MNCFGESSVGTIPILSKKLHHDGLFWAILLLIEDLYANNSNDKLQSWNMACDTYDNTWSHNC